MSNNEVNTEQIILEAAEAEFLEKGYGNAKMVAIAKRADVSHSMLHYYFRSKENLFQVVFQEKIHTISTSFENIFVQHLPFFESIRLIVESQFNFVVQNPKLPHFILNEILSNKENRALLFDMLSPKFSDMANKMEEMLTTEIAKGTIRPIKMSNLMMNIVALNVSVFVLLPIIEDMSPVKDKKFIENMLNERRESNVQFVLNALRP